jgi:tetratricopeptide (TPR) repeat protein
MMKRLGTCRVVLALILCLFAIEGRAQTGDPKARAAEWQSYKLPASPFARYTNTDEALLIFRAPVEWKRQGEQLLFTIADDAQLRVVIDKVPDGLPLRGYVASLLESLRKLPNDADSLTVRRTEMSGLEAREVMFEIADPRGGVSRRIIWSAVDGPRAVSFILIEPLARAAEIEPYFKAVVESAIVSGAGPNTLFELMHEAEFNANQPTRMDETLALVPALDGTLPAERARAIARLSQLFAHTPEAVIDLSVDRRAMVRAAAVEAIAASGNRVLIKFLLRATNDSGVFVADRAAAALAKLPDAVALLRDYTHQWTMVGFQELMNATASLDHKARAQIAAELFKAANAKTLISAATFEMVGPKATAAPPKPARVVPPPPPPPPARKVNVPKGVKLAAPFEAIVDNDAMLAFNKQFIAVNLLRDVPPSALKLPIDEIIAAHNDLVIIAALQTAIERREQLPLEALLKLLDSSSGDVRWLAARCIGEAATAADIARLEARAQKLAAQNVTRPPAEGAAKEQSAAAQPSVKTADELRAAIKMIRLRQEIDKAGGDARRQLIESAMRDDQIADWAWSRFARDEFEGARSDAAIGRGGEAATPPLAKRGVAPLGENLFPTNVQHYVVLPQPGAAIDRLVGALTNLQMPTARSQADLVLALNAWREQIANFVGAPSDGAMLDYLGIKLDAPIAMASWTAASAPRPLASAARKAVVLRVNDRERFERFLTLYEKQFGSFSNLPDYMALGTRFISLAPGFLPLGAKMFMQSGLASLKEPPKLRFDYAGRDACLGYEVKIIAQQEIKRGHITRDAIYLAYVGDAAVLAPDWHSLRDALARLDGNSATLADNSEFKAAVAEGGDAIYLSNLGEALAAVVGGKPAMSRDDKLIERGALRLTNAAWENVFRLSFKASGQADGTITFQPDALDAPRQLLPRSTFAYVFLKLDSVAAWRGWLGDLIGADDRKAFAAIWASDFEREVLPELGPECGAALLGLPDLDSGNWGTPGVLFFKLKSDKLARALAEGKLLNGVPAASGAARVKLGASEVWITIRDGFLVVAGNEATLKRLDGPEKLAAARDFTRAAKAAPDGIFAFGGYNLEAAVAEVASGINDPVVNQVVSVLSSIAGAFHSQNFYVTASGNRLEAHMSVSLDREGRYSVAELSALSKDYRPTFAIIETGGAMIADQRRLESLKLRIRMRATDGIDRLKADLASDTQTVERRSDKEMLVQIRPRRAGEVAHLELPVSGAEFAPFLKAVREIRSDNQRVIEQARQIAGDDKDAWSVARKLADWTYKNITWKRVDSATAVDTLATREADCLEFSQLFVAMARALGLPARIVSGMAYSGGSFGGHAWVEVYAGRWIELDPTWGTDFVDATHVRGASGDLINYAVLNLVEVEVLEAPRAVLDYERDVQALAGKICEELSAGLSTALTATLDAAALAEAHMGAGAWGRLNEHQREQLAAALPRVAYQLTKTLPSPLSAKSATARVMRAHQNGEQAEVTVIVNPDWNETFVKLQFARRGAAWALVEAIVTETEFHIIKESLRPTLDAIAMQRDGKPVATYSDHQRAIFLLSLWDAKGALAVLEPALQKQPDNRVLLNLKAIALSRLKQADEAVKLWTELSQAESPFAPAVYALASHYESSEQADEKQRAAALLARYIALEPDDPRPHGELAALYDAANEKVRAEAEYRAAVALDPRNPNRRLDLAEWLMTAQRIDEALAVMDEGAKQHGITDDLLADLISQLHGAEKGDVAEALAAAHPERIAASAAANLNLAYIRAQSDRAAEALPLLKRALALKKDYLEAHDAMADVYRKLRNWTAALAEADAALAIKADDSEAHYQRACALARLGRSKQAMAALKRAIELDEELADSISEEADLQSLARLPEFKALIPKDEPEPAKKEPDK